MSNFAVHFTHIRADVRQHASSCVSMRQHTPACVSIRQHTSSLSESRGCAAAAGSESSGCNAFARGSSRRESKQTTPLGGVTLSGRGAARCLSKKKKAVSFRHWPARTDRARTLYCFVRAQLGLGTFSKSMLNIARTKFSYILFSCLRASVSNMKRLPAT